MNLESKIDCIKKVLEKQLKSIDNENDNYSLKVKKDYQKKLDSIVTIDGVNYTVEEAYKKALNDRKYLIASLNDEQNSSKQIIILDKLKLINEVIGAYEKFALEQSDINKLSNEYKENSKFKKASYVASCIDQIISYIDEEINKIKEELKSQRKISEINSKEELDKIYSLSSNIINFSNLKSSLKGLLKYDGTNISSSKDIKKLTNNLDSYGCKIVNTLYNLIFNHNLNMNIINDVVYDDIKEDKKSTNNVITSDEVKSDDIIVNPEDANLEEVKPEKIKPIDEVVSKTDEDNFKDLIYKLKTEETISSDDIYKLYNSYNNLSKEASSKYKEDYDRIIILYNNQKQEDYQKHLEKNDIKKYTFAEKVTEFLGRPYQLVVSVKKNILKKLKKKIENAPNEKRLFELQRKAEKLKRDISSSDVVSSVKLFNARNDLSDMKLKLYKGEQLDYSRVTKAISKELNKGLSKKKDDLDILNDKSRAITIMDQYLELVASGSFDIDEVNEAYDYLEKIGPLLTDSEFNGYLEELNIIYDYRNLNKIPYHINQIGNKTEVDDIIRYYDSDEYSKLLNKDVSYIKGK